MFKWEHFLKNNSLKNYLIQLGKEIFSIKIYAKQLFPFFIGTLFSGAVFLVTEQQHEQKEIPLLEGQWEVCFTPSKTCQSLIIRSILNAKKTILVQAYSFTDKEVVDAILKAKRNGVDVRIILDKSNRTDRYSQLSRLKEENISVRIDEPSGIAHNKVIILDEDKVITGSYNFSNAAYKRNTENVLILSDKKLAQEYSENWRYRWSLAVPPSPYLKQADK